MSASLVGSEMCIRDSNYTCQHAFTPEGCALRELAELLLQGPQPSELTHGVRAPSRPPVRAQR
eukprot:6726280-Alexandrium_andersonii.AAC.1